MAAGGVGTVVAMFVPGPIDGFVDGVVDGSVEGDVAATVDGVACASGCCCWSLSLMGAVTNIQVVTRTAEIRMKVIVRCLSISRFRIAYKYRETVPPVPSPTE